MGGNEAKAQTLPPPITVTCSDGLTITYPSVICAGETCGAGAPFTVGGNTANITKYEWDFGVPGSETDTSSVMFPSYRYEAGGTYNGSLKVTRTVNGAPVETTCPFTVTVQQGIPDFDITPDDNLGPQDEEICKGSSATLTPAFRDNQQAPANATYRWSTGQTTPTLTVPDTVGCYSLTITDPATGCSKSQKINITVYKPDPNNPPPPKEESRWYFGNGAGIKFVGGNPEPITGNINAPEGVSSVSGSTGQLLFYTDGRNVYDKAGAPMKDRNGVNVTVADNNALNGGANATQGVLIIAQPGCNDCEPVYYVFTTSDIGTGASGGSLLSYSVVDMRLGDGLGQVTLKNVPLWGNSTERVVGVQGQADPNDQNAQETTWIITHDFNSDQFRVYPLTTQGVGQPKTYAVGETHGSQPAKGESYMKVYDDKIVVTIPGAAGTENIVQVFEFDNTTGEVKPDPLTLRLGTVPPAAPLYGVELYGDSLLYVTTRRTGASDTSKLIQFNLALTEPDSITKYRVVLDSSNTVAYGALQTDPNGQTIYLAKENSNSLGKINSPGTVGRDANFERDGLVLSGGQSGLGLPNTEPPNNQGYGQGLSFDSPVCVPPNTPTVVTLRAQPDRAGGDPAKSSYGWTIKRQDGTVLATYPDAGFGVNDTLAYTFPGPGSYSVTVAINNDCLTEPEEFTEPLYIGVAPPPVTLRDTSVCATATVRLEAYPNQPGPQGATYTWRLANGGTRTGKTINVTIADVTATNSTFTLVVAADSCTQTASARVNFQRINVDLGKDTTVCQATTLLLDADVAGMRYEWTRDGQVIAGETRQVLPVVPAEGSNVLYAVTVTDPITGCSNTSDIRVQRGARPKVEARPKNPTDCAAIDGEILLVSDDPGFGSYQFRWFKDGVQLPVPLTTNAIDGQPIGVYTIRIAGGTGCDTTLTVALNAIPADPNTPPYIVFQELSTEEPNVFTLPCDGTAVDVNGNASLSSGSGALNYEWRDAANRVVWTDPRISSSNGVFVPGVYTLTVTDPNADPNGPDAECRALAVVELKVNPLSPQVEAIAVPAGCSQVLLQAVLTGGNTDPSRYTFRWRIAGSPTPLPETGAAITRSGNGQVTYVVEVTSLQDGTCTASDEVQYTFPPDAPLNPGGPYAAVCAPNTVALNPPTDPNWDIYIWTLPGAGNRTFVGRQFNASETGRYTLTARNSRTGCEKQATVDVTINPTPGAPTFQNPPNVVICAGSVSRPSFAPNNILPGATVRWYNNPALTGTPVLGSSFVPGVTQPNTYVYYVTQSVGSCQSPATPVTLTINAVPVVDLGPDRNVCQGQTEVLNALPRNPGGGPVTYRWENGLTTQTINATRSGTYRVTVTQGTCSVTDEVTLTFVAPPQVTIPRRIVPLCGRDLRATATLDAGPGANFTYEWRKLGSNTVIGTTQKITVNTVSTVSDKYTVSIGNGGSCTLTDTIEVVNKCEPTIFVPDAFAPASTNSQNQRLQVFGQYVGKIRMLIYNRWGELIYAYEGEGLEGLQSDNAWDGNYLGKPAPTGSYVWKITYGSADFPEREPITLRGAVLLVR